MRELPDRFAAYQVHEADLMPATGPHPVFWQERKGALPVRIGERRYIFDAVHPDCTVIYRHGQNVEIPTSMLRPMGAAA